MIKKIILTAAVAAIALSVASTASFAKKGGKAKAKPCTMGQMASGKPNQFGWAPIMACGADGKMYQTMMMCMMASSFCPPPI